MSKSIIRLLVVFLAAIAGAGQANAVALSDFNLSTGDVSFFPNPVSSGDGDVTQASDKVVRVNPALFEKARDGIGIAFGFFSQKFIVDFATQTTGGNHLLASADVVITFSAFVGVHEIATPFVTELHLQQQQDTGDFDIHDETDSHPVNALFHETDPVFTLVPTEIDFRFEITVKNVACGASFIGRGTGDPNRACTATVSVRDPISGVEDPTWSATAEFIPEPATAPLVLSAGALALLVSRRRRAIAR